MSIFRTQAQINLSAVQDNFLAIKRHTRAKICCVVKANAYGHGATKLSRIYQELDADYFAVASALEGVELRKRGIVKPILILGYTPVLSARLLVNFRLMQTVYSADYAFSLNEEALSIGKPISVHIKIDTGMNRLGFNATNCEEELLEICKLSHLQINGVFTHFAKSDEGYDGKSYTTAQFELFNNLVNNIENKGFNLGIKHCCNSAGIFDYPNYHLDMVRAGICLYGLSPSDKVQNFPPLTPVMEWKSEIAQVKMVKKGDAISYGGDFVCPRQMKVATIPVGYADGLIRRYSGNKVLICGKPSTIVGRICMDQFMVDVTNIDCAIGDEVILFGNYENFTANDMANKLNTINYEVLSNISGRVPRTYI